jgi:hypothetical protein
LRRLPWRKIVWAYIEAHGVDRYVLLTIGGMIATIPGIYLGSRIVGLLLDRVPHTYL